MSRKKFIAANLKMHFNVQEASKYIHNLSTTMTSHRDIEVVVAPTFVALQPLSKELDLRKIKLAAQNAYYEDEGAFTGEVSFTMLRGIAQYVIVGHSERRIYFQEDDKIISKKIKAAFRNKIKPILCVGENLTERQDGHAKRVINEQISSALSELTENEVTEMVIAYEPVWAIGTGKVASAQVAQDMHRHIRLQLSEFDEDVASHVGILYGGSVKPDNAVELFAMPDIDGGLVGGASLNPQDFLAICQA